MNSRILLVVVSLSSVAGIELCVNNSNTHIKDLKIDERGQLFYIDAANTIHAVRANCGENVQIHPIPGKIGLGPRIEIPTALTIGLDSQGRRGLYVASLVGQQKLWFLEFDFDTFTVLRFSSLPIQAIYVNELETAPNGDLFVVEQQQAVVRYNVIEQQTYGFLGFSSGITDVLDLAINQECPILMVSANDDHQVYFCLTFDSKAKCRPLPGVTIATPYGIDYDCNCNGFVASMNDTIFAAPLFGPGNPFSELKCAHEGAISAPAHLNQAGSLTSLVGNSGSASYFWFNSGILWAKTRCRNGNSDSWFVNGQRWNVPITQDFTWSRVPISIPFARTVGDVFGSSVRLDVREPNCEIAQLFLGQVPDFLRVARGFLDKKCSSQYVCASEFCYNGTLEIVSTVAQGPSLRATIGGWEPAAAGSVARILFPTDQFEQNPTRTLWLETFCPDGSSDSWYINGVRVNIPITQDFAWHQVASINSREVVLEPREPNCRIRGAFAGLGPARPVLPYSCDCCTENTELYFTQDGNIFRETVTDNAVQCSGAAALVRTPEKIIGELSVFSTCTFQPTAPPTTQSNTASVTPTSSVIPPSPTPTSTRAPSPTPTQSRVVTDVLSFSTIFATGHETGGASQGNQLTSFRNFVAGRGLVTALVLLRQVGGVGAQRFVRFVGTNELAIDLTSHFRLYSALANMRLVQCPTQIPINSLSAFLQTRILSFIQAIPDAPTTLTGVTANSLFLDDVTGVGCVQPPITSIACDPTHNSVPTLCLTANTVKYSWGLTWGSNESPCINENGVQVCLQPFPSASNPTFLGFAEFTSHVRDPSNTAQRTRVQLNTQMQVVRELFPDCSTTKTVGLTDCTPVVTNNEVGSSRAIKSGNFCFQGTLGLSNTCSNTNPSSFGCFCDECCYVFGDCCPDVEFCDGVDLIENECHDAVTDAVDATLPACKTLCGV